MGSDYNSRAHSLIESLSGSLNIHNNVPPCRPAIYDTAVVAMLARPSRACSQDMELVFPESFQYLLDHQQVNGGWEMRGFRVGSILNTAAGLLAIVKRRKLLPGSSSNSQASLTLRANKAAEFLRNQFVTWDPKSDVHSHSMILISGLLAKLREEGIHFQVHENIEHVTPHLRGTWPPQMNDFDQMTESPEVLKSRDIGINRSRCGLSCSPSSTAAFLLQSAVWDEEYEAYLSEAIKATGTRGGVPSLFPPSFTELAYATEVLVESGLLDATTMARISQVDNGRSGEQPPLPSIHNSRILALSEQLLIHKLSTVSNDTPDRDQLETQMLHSIEAPDLKFDEGCRILKTLMLRPKAETFVAPIYRLFEKVCALWWVGKEGTTLSRSSFYSIMLFAQCFAEIHEHFQDRPTGFISLEDTQKRASIILVQMLSRLLSLQNGDGSWGPRGCSETTAYGILALNAMTELPQVRILAMEIEHAIERGRQILFMMQSSWSRAHSLWVSKTAYRSNWLSEAFSLAAMHKTCQLSRSRSDNFLPGNAESQKVLGLAQFFHSLDNLAHEKLFKVKIGALESSFYVSMLRTMRNDIFPVTAAREKDKYLDYIPIMWTTHNIIRGVFAPPQLIWDISVLSMFIFLVDEYMESKVAIFTQDEFIVFRKGIEEMFTTGDYSQPSQDTNTSLQSSDGNDAATRNPTTRECPVAKSTHSTIGMMTWSKTNILSVPTPDSSSISSDRVRAALSILNAWARYHMTYTSVLSSSTLDLLDLRMETRNYLLYHIHQLEDNQRLTQQPRPTSSSSSSPAHLCFQTPRMGYAPWVHTIGGGHIGAPIGLVFFACVVGSRVRGEGKDCFRTVRQKLMAWNVNTHAAKQLRMYNDYGSVARDAAEGNLSSVNFPEFFGDGDDTRGTLYPGSTVGGDDDDCGDEEDYGAAKFRLKQTKETLLQAAELERRHTNAELAELLDELRKEGCEGAKIADWLGVYYAGGDQFSDMYLVRDVTNTTKEAL